MPGNACDSVMQNAWDSVRSGSRFGAGSVVVGPGIRRGQGRRDRTRPTTTAASPTTISAAPAATKTSVVVSRSVVDACSDSDVGVPPVSGKDQVAEFPLTVPLLSGGGSGSFTR